MPFVLHFLPWFECIDSERVQHLHALKNLIYVNFFPIDWYMWMSPLYRRVHIYIYISTCKFAVCVCVFTPTGALMCNTKNKYPQTAYNQRGFCISPALHFSCLISLHNFRLVYSCSSERTFDTFVFIRMLFYGEKKRKMVAYGHTSHISKALR